MKGRTKAVVASAAGLVLLVGGAGAAVAAHYQDRALPGTSVGGTSVAGMTRDEVADLVKQRAAAATVTVTAGGSTSTQSLAQLGSTSDVAATVDSVFSANKSWGSYVTSWMSRHDVAAVVTTDAAKVDDAVHAAVTAGGNAAINATVSLSADKTSFVVTPAVPGQTVDPTSLQAVASAAASTLTSQSTTVRYITGEPKVTTAMAQQAAAEANALIAQTVSVSDGTTTHTASAADKAAWVTITATDDTIAAPTLDQGKVAAWLTTIADATKVTATNGVRNVDAQGTVVTVVKAAVDGKAASNVDDLATQITAALGAGKAFSGAFTYSTVAATWTSRQVAAGSSSSNSSASPRSRVAWSTCTSRATATPTVVGVFHVYLKLASQTMRGNNADGSGYVSPGVPWISYFYRGYALHGAPWRSSFGYAASHGCINLPVPVAKWMYDWDEIGTPVVTHL